MSSTSIKNYMFRDQNTWPLWASMAVSFGVLIAMMCNVSLARTFPQNYALLTVFTLAESVVVGSICAVRSPLHPASPLQHKSRQLDAVTTEELVHIPRPVRPVRGGRIRWPQGRRH